LSKLILLSIVAFMTIVPLAVSTTKAPRRALRLTQVATLLAVLVWALACRECYPRLVPVE
jgi:hypothetical protein